MLCVSAVQFHPLIPFWVLPELPLIPRGALGSWGPAYDISIKPFGSAVALGVYLGIWVTLRQGRRLGLDEGKLSSLVAWVVGGGFVAAHLLDVVFYSPERLLADPLVLFRLWDGLSSFGGFVGGAAGALIWRHFKRESLFRYGELLANSFPLGWAFGRLGCSIAHDHPGVRSEFWLAMAYPGGGRFDLGFLELLLTIPLAVAFLVLQRQPKPGGFFLGSMMLAYAPCRFVLDFLRVTAIDRAVADARYLNLTPAQWGCVVLLFFGSWLFLRAMTADQEADFPAVGG